MSENRSGDLARSLFQLLLIGALIAGVFWVVSPFLAAGAWAATMVVATWPLLLRAQSALGGKRSLAVVVMTIALLLVLVVPLYVGISTIVGNIDAITAGAKAVLEFAGLPPPSWVETVPLVGSRLAGFWRELAAAGPTALSERIMPHIQEITSWILGQVGGVGATMVDFLLAVGIASVLYLHGESAAAGLGRFAKRVGGEQTESALVLAGQAVRAVALGVGVTAMVQSLLAGVGLAVAGIPFAGALTALIFVLCVAQLGPGIVLLPVIGWLYWRGQSAWGTALLVYSIPILALDGFLRPVLIKRGADLPILLILPGVIGGLLAFGVIGLFIGPVLLAVGYTLLVAWIAEGKKARARG